MLKLSIAASLLVISLSVDAFAVKPDETDGTGTTTAARVEPNNRKHTGDRRPSIERMRILFKDPIFQQTQNPDLWMLEERLKLFKKKSDAEFASTYETFKAEYNRRKAEIHQEAETKTRDLTDPQSFRNFAESLLNSMSSEQVSLTPVDTSTLLEETDTE